MSDDEDWDEEREDDMIDLFQANSSLWKVDSEEYFERDKKRTLKDLIARRLKTTVKDIEKHWRSLRTQYRRAVAIDKSGSGAKVLTVRQKFLVSRLRFLAPYTKGASAVISSLDIDTDEEEEEVAADAIASTSSAGNGGGDQVNMDFSSNQLGGQSASTSATSSASVSAQSAVVPLYSAAAFVPPPFVVTQSVPTASTSAEFEVNPATDQQPSGVSTRSKRSSSEPVMLSPVKRTRRRSTAAPLKPQQAQNGSSVSTVLQTPLVPTQQGSPRSPTPPPPKTQQPTSTPVKQPRGARGKKKAPKVSLNELRQMIAEDEAAEMAANTQMDPDRTFSTLDESPLVDPIPRKAAPKKSAFDEERTLAVKEFRGYMQDSRQRQVTPVGPKKADDEIAIWAGIERKVRRLTDPLLQEDVMDFLSLTLKRAARGEWSVESASASRSASASASASASSPIRPQVPQVRACPSPAVPAFSSFSVRSQPMMASAATGSSVLPIQAAPTQQHFTSGHPMPHMPPMPGDQQVHAFAQWLQSNSPGLPAGPIARHVAGGTLSQSGPPPDYTTMQNAGNN